MFKKVIALLLMQLYLVAAFGVTVGQASCCDQTNLSEAMDCHGDGTMPAVTCHEEPTPAELTSLNDRYDSVIDCTVCLIGDHSGHPQDCCPDCDIVYFSVQKENLTEQNYTNTSISFNLQKLQAVVILLPWVADYAILTLLTGEEPNPESPHLASASEVPIFIRDCTYRI